MFDFSRLAQSPEQQKQMQEVFFQFMAQQAGQMPPEMKDAYARTEVVVTKMERGFSIKFGDCGHPDVEKIIPNSIDQWTSFLARAFNTTGFSVTFRCPEG
jgi:hypothetical protein